MTFRIGKRRYRLKVVPGKLLVDGATALGAAMQSRAEILLSSELPHDDRLRVLCRELFRCWVFETGRPDSTEGWLSLAATMAMQLSVDLNAAGGELGLLSLRPGEDVENPTIRIPLTRNRQCAKCGGTVAGASVECSPDTPGVVRMSLYCEFCGITQRWSETQGGMGLPTGQVVGEPVFESGDTTQLMTTFPRIARD